jgi:hypothetical protein
MNKNYTDILGGALLIVIGLAAALYARGLYDLGTLSEMGPGMFPTAIGYALAGLGVIIALPGFFRAGGLPKAEWRPLVFIIGGVLLFALTVDRAGMIPALVLLTAASILADPKMGWIGSIVLTVIIIIAAVLLFRTGLGIPIPLLKWGF